MFCLNNFKLISFKKNLNEVLFNFYEIIWLYMNYGKVGFVKKWIF